MSKTFYIINEHELLRIGTASYIEKNSDWKSLGDAPDIEKAFSDFESFAKNGEMPSVVISDLNFYGKDTGFELVKRFHELYPQQKIIVYSMFFAPGIVQNAIQSGACGYVSKNATSNELLACMEKALLRHLSNDEIAEKMNLKKRAVENYISAIYEKTNIIDRAELIRRFG